MEHIFPQTYFLSTVSTVWEDQSLVIKWNRKNMQQYSFITTIYLWYYLLCHQFNNQVWIVLLFYVFRMHLYLLIEAVLIDIRWYANFLWVFSFNHSRLNIIKNDMSKKKFGYVQVDFVCCVATFCITELIM